VEGLLRDSPAVSRMRVAARAEAERRFDRSAMISAYEALFRAVAAA